VRTNDEELHGLYAKYAPDRFSVSDQAYIAGVHPLEIAVVSYLLDHPGAAESEVQSQTALQRQEAYAWLFKTCSRHKQDVRLRILLEEEAFDRILEDWRRQGYPFSHLVPSLSTAIGSSGDRPDALAQLISIVLNGGVRKPIVDLARLAFAVGTPYETVLGAHPSITERVMALEAAASSASVAEMGTVLAQFNAGGGRLDQRRRRRFGRGAVAGAKNPCLSSGARMGEHRHDDRR